MKKYILIIILLFVPIFVKAGSISFGESIKTSNTSYKFYITVNDMSLNNIKGNFYITNGYVSNIIMENGWVNKNGNSNSFYFYYDGIKTDSYNIATVEVIMNNNSNYTINNLQYGINKCLNEFNLYYGENGNIVNKNTYDNTCGLSNDGTLKTLIPSVGSLTPNFDSKIFYYYLNVLKDVEQISFNAIPNHSKAKVISGTTCNLDYGTNNCEIYIETERKTKERYVIYVYRQKDGNSYDITDFKVDGGILITPFNINIYEYKVKVNKGTERIYFSFKTENGKNTHSVSCSADSENCTLTISPDGSSIKRKYIFNLINEDTSYPNEYIENNKITTNQNNSINNNNNNTNNSTNNENNINIEEQPKDNIINNKEDKNKYICENEDTMVLPFVNIEIPKTKYLIELSLLLLIVMILIIKLWKGMKK